MTKRFRVLDAGTGEPVAGARVVVVHDFDWMSDWVIRGTTGPDGVASVELARDYLHLVRAHVRANGYQMRGSVYFQDGSRGPGTGRLADDPVDIRLFRGPPPRMGVRIPAGFRGTIRYRLGETKYAFAYPPTFPAGQRTWWTDADVRPGGLTVLEQPPRLGGTGWDGTPVAVARVGETEIPVAEPGEDVRDGTVAAWHIGMTNTPGPHGGERYVLVVGTSDDALAEARAMWQRHANSKFGFIYNGWLRVVSPETKLTTGERPYAVTRMLDDRDGAR